MARIWPSAVFVLMLSTDSEVEEPRRVGGVLCRSVFWGELDSVICSPTSFKDPNPQSLIAKPLHPLGQATRNKMSSL